MRALKPYNFKQSIDIPAAFTAIILSSFGLLMIYSASCYNANLDFGDAFFYVKKQAVALVFGLIAMGGLAYFKIELLQKFKYIILAVSLVLLALVFIPGFGVESYGATRWLNLGFSTIQPSEYSKFGLVIFIAGFTAKADMAKFRNVLIVLAAGGAVCVLLMLEPNMSITVCVGVVMIVMLFIAGVKIRHLAYVGLPACIALPLLIILEPYRLKRLSAFLDPWSSPLGEGYQLIQSYYDLGSGGFFGVGLFNSRQKYMYLPFSESDFILSIIGEELGWCGCIFVALLFSFLVYRGILIAVKADTRFKSYLAAGISVLIAVQAVLNFAVVSGAIPPTGLPLPFVSAGGSSLVAFLSSVGLLLNISRKSRKNL